MATDIQVRIPDALDDDARDLVPLASGGFVAVWDAPDGGEMENRKGVCARLFDAVGRPVSGEIRVADDLA